MVQHFFSHSSFWPLNLQSILLVYKRIKITNRINRRVKILTENHQKLSIILSYHVYNKVFCEAENSSSRALPQSREFWLPFWPELLYCKIWVHQVLLKLITAWGEGVEKGIFPKTEVFQNDLLKVFCEVFENWEGKKFGFQAVNTKYLSNHLHLFEILALLCLSRV